MRRIDILTIATNATIRFPGESTILRGAAPVVVEGTLKLVAEDPPDETVEDVRFWELEGVVVGLLNVISPLLNVITLLNVGTLLDVITLLNVTTLLLVEVVPVGLERGIVVIVVVTLLPPLPPPKPPLEHVSVFGTHVDPFGQHPPLESLQQKVPKPQQELSLQHELPVIQHPITRLRGIGTTIGIEAGGIVWATIVRIAATIVANRSTQV